MSNKLRTILGIDPGTNIMGYGILTISAQKKLECKSLGIVKLDKNKENANKLIDIYNIVDKLILKHNPNELAIESPFLGKNPQSMLKLGRAQGVVMATCLKHNMEVFEYTPKQVKLSVTGNGNAQKEQLHKMLEQILHIKIEAKYLDATDALGIAICHFFKK